MFSSCSIKETSFILKTWRNIFQRPRLRTRILSRNLGTTQKPRKDGRNKRKDHRRIPGDMMKKLSLSGGVAAHAANKINRMLLEWCCSDFSFFGMPSVDSRGCTVTRLTMREDMTSDVGCKCVQSAVNTAPKGATVLLWSAIPCTGGSPWHNFNKRLLGGMERIQEHWALFRTLWNTFVNFDHWLSQTGRRWINCTVWQKGCGYWRWKTVRVFAQVQLAGVCVDGCAIGLRARSGELMKKP